MELQVIQSKIYGIRGQRVMSNFDLQGQRTQRKRFGRICGYATRASVPEIENF